MRITSYGIPGSTREKIFIDRSAEIMDNTNAREGIINEILMEREYQESKWGDSFDEKNTPNDWIAYIMNYAGKAVTMPWDAKQFRTALLKVATLCLAAIEWCDRSMGSMPKRHYD